MAGQASGGQNLTPNRNVSAPAGFGGDRWGANGGGITPMAGSKPVAATLADGETATNLQLGAAGGISIGGAGLTLSTQPVVVTNGTNPNGPAPISPNPVAFLATSAIDNYNFASTIGAYYLYSPDGVSWIQQRVNGSTDGTSTLGQAAWSPTKRLWVVMDAGLSNTAYTSPDGKLWTTVSMPGAVNSFWQAVAWCPGLNGGNGFFVAANTNGTLAQAIATSPDGVTWTSRASPMALNSAVGGANFLTANWISWANSGAGQALIGRSNNLAGGAPSDSVYSTDGITWTQSTPAATVAYVGEITDTGPNNKILWSAAWGGGSQALASNVDGGRTWVWVPTSVQGTVYFPTLDRILGYDHGGTNNSLRYYSMPVTSTVPGSLPAPTAATVTLRSPQLTSVNFNGITVNGNYRYSSPLGLMAFCPISGSGYAGTPRILTTSDGINFNGYYPTLNQLTAPQLDNFPISGVWAADSPVAAPGIGFFDGQTNQGAQAGSVSGSGAIAGAHISALAYTNAPNAFGFGPAGAVYLLALAGVVPQSTIKSVTFNTSTGPTTFNSAGAIFSVYTNPPGTGQKFSIWLWPTTDTPANAFNGAASTIWTIVTSTMLVGNQNVMSNESIGVLNRQLDDSALPAGPTNQG